MQETFTKALEAPKSGRTERSGARKGIDGRMTEAEERAVTWKKARWELLP